VPWCFQKQNFLYKLSTFLGVGHSRNKEWNSRKKDWNRAHLGWLRKLSGFKAPWSQFEGKIVRESIIEKPKVINKVIDSFSSVRVFVDKKVAPL